MALRTIAFAYKDLKQGEGGPDHLDIDSDGIIHKVEKSGLTLIAIVGIRDVIRQEVPDAIGRCTRAGITVRMITGDNKINAMAIGLECNIINRDQTADAVMEGSEFWDRIGKDGLWCKSCERKSPCGCRNPNDVIKNIETFRPIF